jgi:hypothetical protein
MNSPATTARERQRAIPSDRRSLILSHEVVAQHLTLKDGQPKRSLAGMR